MSRSNAGRDDVMYLDEIHEVSKPLTSTDADAIPSVHRPQDESNSLPETSKINGIQSMPELGINRDRVNGQPTIDFNNEPKRPFVPSNFGSRDFLPPQEPLAQVTPDVNVYQHKKTLAQGMMDLALLSANANQMRYVLQTDGQHPYYYPSLTMIGMSLLLQIAVGIGLIWNSRYNVKEHEQMCKANKANNWTVIGIFLVTIFNVFISSFGVVDRIATTAAAA